MLVYHVGYPTLLVSDVQQVPVATAWPYLARESMVVKKKIGGSEKNMKISGYLEKSMKVSGSLEFVWNLKTWRIEWENHPIKWGTVQQAMID